ncbi:MULTISPECIES: hypothetical protein [Methylomonas]|uniref:hypothetical protein n=1 Tax=Methylomonas TaxID=416 RepID=UPI000A76CD0C|nr:hypothetical protein [Methylomonas koyamae]
MATQQLNHFGLDNQKFDMFKTSSPQRFGRTEVIVHQSISEDDRLLDARRVLAEGGSLFMEEQKRRWK